jgi:uncharacterized membrane protein YsdA (DUF1294 family)
MSFIFDMYIIASLCSILLYYADKEFAKNNHRRIPEKYLHISDALGGWIGAYFAMRWFKHKRQKTEYLKVYYLIVGAHLLLWLLMFRFF